MIWTACHIAERDIYNTYLCIFPHYGFIHEPWFMQSSNYRDDDADLPWHLTSYCWLAGYYLCWNGFVVPRQTSIFQKLDHRQLGFCFDGRSVRWWLASAFRLYKRKSSNPLNISTIKLNNRYKNSKQWKIDIESFLWILFSNRDTIVLVSVVRSFFI